MNEIEIIKEIGAGSFSTTYLAIFNYSTLIVVKDFKNNSTQPEAVAEILFYETKGSSDYFIKYLGNSSTCLYLEYAICSLEDFINKYAPLPTEYAIQIFFELVKAIKYMHDELKIAHRDIKPSNILLSTNGVFKIADFGCVCNTANKENNMIGTELYRPKHCSSAVSLDYYGLACCLFELLTGKKYIEDTSLVDKYISDCIINLTTNDEDYREFYFENIFQEPIFRSIDETEEYEICVKETSFDFSNDSANINAVFSSNLCNRILTDKYKDILFEKEEIIYEGKSEASLFKKPRLLLITDYCRLLGDQIIDLKTAKVIRIRKLEIKINELNILFENVSELQHFLEYYYFAKFDAKPIEECYCGNKFKIFCEKCKQVCEINGKLILLKDALFEELPYEAELYETAQSLCHKNINATTKQNNSNNNIIIYENENHKYNVVDGPSYNSIDLSEVSEQDETPTEVLQEMDEFLQLSNSD